MKQQYAHGQTTITLGTTRNTREQNQQGQQVSKKYIKIHRIILKIRNNNKIYNIAYYTLQGKTTRT
jgi:hypothetical protein